ncbi:MAG: hypothetical protein WAV28_11210 [Sedimentisphaerales bacterium]|jgi:hypothetical protein
MDEENKNIKKNAIAKKQEDEHQVIDEYQKIINRADKEIERVHRTYYLVSKILGVIIVAGITAVTFITWNTIADMRGDLREETNTITSRFNDEVDLVGRQVRSRIEEEFNKENIHDLVQTTAKERIDAVADVFISEKIDEKVIPLINVIVKQIEDANNRLVALEDKFTNDLKVKQETFIEYLITVSAAENGDRKSYERLKTWGEDNTFMLSSQANVAYGKIRSMHNSPIYRSGFNVPWKEGIDPSKLSLSDLKKNYENISASAPRLKLALIEYIWKREDIQKRNRMEFLIEVLKTDDSLDALEYAGRFFSEGAGVKFHPLASKEILDWWGKNKEKIK